MEEELTKIEEMLNSITNDLDILLSEFCQLSYPEPAGPAVQGHSKPRRLLHGKKPMHFENCSAFGGSSTSGTLTSTDSNHSNKDVLSGTLTSTDSNNSVSRGRNTICQPSCVDVVGVSLTRALEQPVYPEKQPSPSRSTSGSDLRQITVLERLTKTHPIWYLPTVARSGAVHLLKDREIGIFIVRKSSRDDTMALSVQFPTGDGTPNVDHYLIEPRDEGLHLQGSNKLFSAIPNLVAHYCDNNVDPDQTAPNKNIIRVSNRLDPDEAPSYSAPHLDPNCLQREDLPYRLVLPHAIRMAKTSQELAGLSMLGQDFWTSSKFEGQSRSSSKSNLSDQSSNMNKSMSEPISITKTPVTAYSQSEPLIQNTPPKHSVIDFKSYLIKPKETVEMRKCTRSVSVNESVHMKCSFQEKKQCNHVPVGHVMDHVTECDSCLQEQERCATDMVLHWELQQTAGSEMKRQDSQVSVPYAKPDKSIPGTGKSNLYFQTPLDLLNIPDDYYFRSNLSDKLSDYEDIWKNNYSESNVGSVQADIVQRLQPNLVTFNNNNNNNMITNNINRTSNDVVHRGCASVSVSESTSVKQEHLSEMCVKESNISVVESHSSVQNVTMFSSSNVISHHSEMSESMTAVKENNIRYDSACPAEESGVVESLSVLTVGEKPDKAPPEADVNCNFMLGPFEENKSDTDTEGCHSNSCPSDEDAEADTEDVDDCPNISSVQTQTSPMWKLSPIYPGCVARKSVSTTMLTAMKSPVYAEPFDAISPDGQKTDEVPRLPKKMRRRSAPAVTSPRKRLGLSEHPRLSPVVASHVEDINVNECCGNAFDEIDGLEQDLCGDNDEVFQISPDLCVEYNAKGKQDINDGETYGKAWEGAGVTKPNAKNKHSNKPVPNRRTTKCTEKHEKEAINRECAPHVALTNVEEVRVCHSASDHTPVSMASNVQDQIHILENFDTNHVPSSPTLCKFPVYSRQISEDTRNMFPEGSTAEDMICTWNPELTLKPLRPFPVLGDGGAMSEYDNLNNPSYITPSVASAGTIFCNPWENSVVGKLINTHAHPPAVPHKITKSQPPASAPPPLPPPMDTRERIKAWQKSSQKYHSVSIGNEEDHRFSIISDGLQSMDAVTFGGELSSSYDFKVSSNGQSQSDKTLVNEKSSQSGGPGVKVAGNIPLYGADFREKVAPILANPPLLNKPDRNRNPDRKIRDYIIKLSKDRDTTFGSTIENFIQCTLESHDTNPFNITRNVRQFMNGIKNYLVKHGEGELEDLIERERSKLGQDEILNIDAIIEGALHVCVIQPLKQNIYRLFVNEYTKNGNLKLLSNNIKYARTKTAEEIGIRKGLAIPTGPTLEMIKHYFTRMQKSYSPLKKLENLLGATSAIYRCVTGKQQSASSFGADDFLPMLIYILIQCGMVSVEIEADYMWGLLHPSLLTGEGGYYLTSLSSAVLVLKNFQEMQETKASQHEGKMPSISDMQGFIKIAIPDEHRDTIVWKTLPVRPTMTTKDVCSLIAHKFKFTNPQDYGLYTLENGEESKLMDMECPQGLKVERLSRSKECIFAYKRNAANIAWPKSVQ